MFYNQPRILYISINYETTTIILSVNSGSCQQPNYIQDPDFFLYKEDVIREKEGFPSISLLGKLVARKLIHKGSIQTALANIWCNSKNLVVKEVETIIF